MQIKGNFRDKAVASFGGELFHAIADQADDVYNTQDPPKPSLAAQVAKKPAAVAQPAPKVETAAQFAE